MYRELGCLLMSCLGNGVGVGVSPWCTPLASIMIIALLIPTMLVQSSDKKWLINPPRSICSSIFKAVLTVVALYLR